MCVRVRMLSVLPDYTVDGFWFVVLSIVLRASAYCAVENIPYSTFLYENDIGTYCFSATCLVLLAVLVGLVVFVVVVCLFAIGHFEKDIVSVTNAEENYFSFSTDHELSV